MTKSHICPLTFLSEASDNQCAGVIYWSRNVFELTDALLVQSFGPGIKLQFWSTLKLFEAAFLVRTKSPSLLDPSSTGLDWTKSESIGSPGTRIINV